MKERVKKKGYRVLAFLLVLTMVMGVSPFSIGNEVKAASEPILKETIVFSDSFDDGTNWDTSAGKWRLGGATSHAQYVGVRNGTAPLGYATSTRNLYDVELNDVHVKADVCVTKAQCTGSNLQYHFIFARGNTSGTDSIAFGFKTIKNATKSSLIIGYYTGYDGITIWYETEAVYDWNTTYTLDLYVVGSLVIAKCNNQTVFIEEQTGISAKGYCGIIDRRATSNSSGGTYGTDYTKAGYFDNFSVGTVEEVVADGFKVNGPVVITKDGVGVADITLVSNGVDGATIDDAVVKVDALKNKETNLYEGEYTVSTTLSGVEKTSVATRVFVVDDLSKTVTKMSDSRWTGETATDNSNFTVDENGKATLTNKKYSVLSMGDNDAAYNEFYAEYTLNLSDIATGKRNWYSTCFNIGTRASYSTGFTGDVLHDLRDGREAFYARLQQRQGNKEVGNYAKGTTNGDVAIGDSMRIGLLVYDSVITYTLNGNVVGTYTYPEGAEASKGWLALYNDVESNSMATVEDFIYVPLSEKAVVDIEVSKIEDVQRYGTITTPSVTPIYNWPNGSGEVTTDGVTIEGFDNAKVGEQTVTVKYTENNVTFSKKVTVKVVDDSIKTIISEDFEENGLSNSDEWTTLENVHLVDGGKLVMNSKASAQMSGGVNAGCLETTLAIADTTLTSLGKAVDFKYQVDNRNYIILRLTVAKDAEGIETSKLQVYVYIDNSQSSSAPYTINNFALNTQYKVCFKVIGNYVEVKVNGEVVQKLQYSLGDTNDLITGNGRFGFETTSDATVTMDDLSIVKYTPYTIKKDETITLQNCTYTDISEPSKSWPRSAFYSGEQVVLAVSEEQQLAVGGLTYTLDGVADSATYSVFERLYAKDTKPEVCNQFKFKMPSCNITLDAEYYDKTSEKANIGARDTGIREKDGTYKYGLRFSSRAYTTYTSGEAIYTLKEVGTLLFNGDVTITNNILSDCYQTKNNGKKLYNENDVLIGKCIPATKAQNICDDFWDWGVILTYQDSYEGTNLYEKEYKAYAYAVYVDSNGNEVVHFASDAKSATHSYNAVAEAIGWSTH